MIRSAAILLGLLLAAALSLPSIDRTGAMQEDPFPHADHQGLFPLCAGCHEGIPLADTVDWYPEPASCDGCHDGVERARVTWLGPSDRVDNVRFEHAVHAQELVQAGDPEATCASCHIAPGGGRMEVADSIQLETCWSCHAHQTDDHFATEASCAVCHEPLAATRFDRARIERFEEPASHEAADFILEGHGTLAPGRTDQCATCHTRDRCVACHVEAGLAEIQALAPAPPGMELPPATASYPEPASHLDDLWLELHQQDAAPGECSTCHTQNDCRTCHIGSTPALMAALPTREEATAPGVMLESHAPASHGSLFFQQAHSVLASADAASCETCHVDRFCVDCHDAEPGGGYHPQNFMVRHSADAYGRDAECSNCHESRVFCRACHADLGLAGLRREAAGYHDGSPLWLLRHGQAARQGLESCASCHRQVDCTRCHGVLGAFKVSPHSATFDAAGAWARSPRTCLACHVGNPLNGRVP